MNSKELNIFSNSILSSVNAILRSTLNQPDLNVEQKEKNDRKIITLGTWENDKKEKKPVKWLVLKEDEISYFCIAKKALFNHCFNDSPSKGSEYSKSDIRKYLNKDFYNTCFSEDEKLKIMSHKISGEFSKDIKDYVFLLSTSEIEQLMTNNERVIGSWWYTRTATNTNKVYDHSSNEAGFNQYLTDIDGIRPAILIRK